jgi:hypothetical protein
MSKETNMEDDNRLNELEDRVEDLQDENEILKKELSLSSPLGVNALITHLKEYLDWIDAPNRTMDDGGVRLVQTQLRSALNDALLELR